MRRGGSGSGSGRGKGRGREREAEGLHNNLISDRLLQEFHNVTIFHSGDVESFRPFHELTIGQRLSDES